MLAQQTELINGFEESAADTNFWNWEFSTNATEISKYDLEVTTTDFVEGTGAYFVDYAIEDVESYGGYGKIERFHPDSNGVFDFSRYKNISFWYKVITPADVPGVLTLYLPPFPVHLYERINVIKDKIIKNKKEQLSKINLSRSSII